MIENIAHKDIQLDLTLKRIDTPQNGVETSNTRQVTMFSRMWNKVWWVGKLSFLIVNYLGSGTLPVEKIIITLSWTMKDIPSLQIKCL